MGLAPVEARPRSVLLFIWRGVDSGLNLRTERLELLPYIFEDFANLSRLRRLTGDQFVAQPPQLADQGSTIVSGTSIGPV